MNGTIEIMMDEHQNIANTIAYTQLLQQHISTEDNTLKRLQEEVELIVSHKNI